MDDKIYQAAMANGNIIGYGVDEKSVHTDGGYPHDSFFAAKSLAGVLRVFAANVDLQIVGQSCGLAITGEEIGEALLELIGKGWVWALTFSKGNHEIVSVPSEEVRS